MTMKNEVALFSAALRKDLLTFARRSFQTLHNGNELSNDLYVRAVCAKLEQVSSGKRKRQIVNLPPRHAKTFLAAVCLAAWTLAHDPSQQIMIVCYGETLASSIAYDVRRILQSPWFRVAFDCRIADDRSAVSDFQTTAGGGLFATSIGGATTGRGADLIIVDDANKIEDAGSPSELERVHRLFDTAIVSRLNDPSEGRIVVVAHRLGAMDLTGHLLALGGWTKLALPLVAERTTSHRYGDFVWKRRRGDVLRRGADNLREINRLRQTCKIPDFETLYQQRPGPTSVRLSREHFRRFSKPPAEAGGYVFSIDTAQGEGANRSFTVMQVWRRAGENHLLIDQWRAQASFDAVRRQLRHFIGQNYPTVILIEETGIGSALLSEARKKGAARGMAVLGIAPGTASKGERLRRVSGIIRAGRVWLPESKAFVEDYLSEFDSFPTGATNDQVDATSQYLTWAAENEAPTLISRSWAAIGNTRSGTVVSPMTTMTLPPRESPWAPIGGPKGYVWSPR